MNWLREGLEGISESDIEIPNGEVEDGEKVVGILESIEVRKLHELRRRLVHDMNKLKKDAMHKVIDTIEDELSEDHNSLTCENCALSRQFELLNHKREALDILFWTCLRHELSEDVRIQSDDMMSTGVGIRKDWQIVLLKSVSPLAGILFKLGSQP